MNEQGDCDTLNYSQKRSLFAMYCEKGSDLTGCEIKGGITSFYGSNKVARVHRKNNCEYAVIVNLNYMPSKKHVMHYTAECFATVKLHNENPCMQIEAMCRLAKYDSLVIHMEDELRKIA